MDIAPTAEGTVRPDLLDYSDTTEHALMCQATLCQILTNPTPFYSITAQQNKKPQKKPQTHETSSYNSMSYLTSHNS